MTTVTDDGLLTLNAAMVPGSGCAGHMPDLIPGGLGYQDQHGFTWCITCAKVMTECAGERCGHPRAVFAVPGAEAAPGGQEAGL